jgi:transcriptional regulator with XRE-family HTH domain
VEFHEKLQELRKNKGLTQEELAEALYVSRTAISKWESGKGYPSIDSLKQISTYFSVSIDALLSGEALLSLAEKEHKTSLRQTYDLLFGITDLFSFLLIALPLYPKTIDGYIYAVNLLAYGDTTSRNLILYWAMFIGLAGLGILRIWVARRETGGHSKVIADLSMGLGILIVIFLALSREAYAATLAFLLLVIKGVILLRTVRISVPLR